MLWANTLVLGLGGALLTLPVILHLLMQPKPKSFEFPALKFVKRRQFANKSRTRLRHLLLLLLRCLMILCMAAALAGPSVASREFGQWITVGAIGVLALVVLFSLLAVFFGSEHPNRLLLAILSTLLIGLLSYGGWGAFKLLNSDSAQLIGDSAAPVSALILIDNSCRMQYEHQNKTNLDRAKETGNWLITQFPVDSQVCVLTSNNDTPFFSVDLGAAKNRIENLETEYESLPLPDKVAAGLQLLDEAIHERKELYVLSDLSRRSWESAESSIANELKLSNSVSVFVVDVGQDPISNLTVSPLEIKNESITHNGGVEIATSVSGIGGAVKRNVRFQLERPDSTRPVVRDRKVLLPEKFVERVRTVDIPANGAAPVSFRFSEKLPLGIHHGKVEIVGEDSLTVDDIQYFTIEVVDSWNVLIVYGSDVVPDNLYESLTDGTDAGLFDVTLARQIDLPDNLKRFDAVFLLDPDPEISETLWVTLREYVAAGHGLGIFPGANAADGAFGHASFQSEEAQKILTGKLNRQWRRPDADLYLSPDSLTHPIFAPFRDWETAVPWSKFPIYYHWGIEQDDRWEELPTQTVLRYGNGKPAIIERQIGDGRVIIMTTPITDSEQMEGRESWNSLFSGFAVPAWLLVREISQYLVQSQSDRLNIQVGELARLKNDFRKYPETWRIFTPRTTQTPEKATASGGIIRYRFTNSPGQYRLKGNFNGPVSRGFSVNLAAGETDLTRVEPAELDKVFGAGQFQLAKKRSQIQRQQGTMRRGQEFYPLLLLLLVVIMGVEYLLANRFYS